VDRDVLTEVSAAVARLFGVEIRAEAERLRWRAIDVTVGEVAAVKALVVTEVDLFIPMLSFIYGQAQLGGPAAIVSLARLRQEFYDLPADAGLLGERARKESLHELGHTLGLVHCHDAGCVMSLATNIRQVDLKSGDYCRLCRALLAERGVMCGDRFTRNSSKP
jgi:predicted Zn-dependent protease